MYELNGLINTPHIDINHLAYMQEASDSNKKSDFIVNVDPRIVSNVDITPNGFLYSPDYYLPVKLF